MVQEHKKLGFPLSIVALLLLTVPTRYNYNYNYSCNCNYNYNYNYTTSCIDTNRHLMKANRKSTFQILSNYYIIIIIHIIIHININPSALQ